MLKKKDDEEPKGIIETYYDFVMRTNPLKEVKEGENSEEVEKQNEEIKAKRNELIMQFASDKSLPGASRFKKIYDNLFVSMSLPFQAKEEIRIAKETLTEQIN